MVNNTKIKGRGCRRGQKITKTFLYHPNRKKWENFRAKVRPKEGNAWYGGMHRQDESKEKINGLLLCVADSAPFLTYRFIDQTLQPGPPVSLKCSARGSPTPHITWSVNGFPLPISQRYTTSTITFENISTLLIFSNNVLCWQRWGKTYSPMMGWTFQTRTKRNLSSREADFFLLVGISIMFFRFFLFFELHSFGKPFVFHNNEKKQPVTGLEQ